jgi:hypothetical protein
MICIWKYYNKLTMTQNIKDFIDEFSNTTSTYNICLFIFNFILFLIMTNHPHMFGNYILRRKKYAQIVSNKFTPSINHNYVLFHIILFFLYDMENWIYFFFGQENWFIFIDYDYQWKNQYTLCILLYLIFLFFAMDGNI